MSERVRECECVFIRALFYAPFCILTVSIFDTSGRDKPSGWEYFTSKEKENYIQTYIPGKEYECWMRPGSGTVEVVFHKKPISFRLIPAVIFCCIVFFLCVATGVCMVSLVFLVSMLLCGLRLTTMRPHDIKP